MIIEKTTVIVFNEHDERIRLKTELPEGSKLQRIFLRQLDMLIAGEFDQAFELVQILRPEQRQCMHATIKSIMDDIRARRKQKYTGYGLKTSRLTLYPRLNLISSSSHNTSIQTDNHQELL